MFKNYLEIYKRYKALILSILGLVVVILPLVLVIFYGVDIATKLKTYRYIGAGLQYKNTISVNGEGKVYTKPDIAMVSLSVVSEGKRVIDVQNENSKKANQVIKFLKESSIAEKDIKTTGYNLYPIYNYEERTPRIVGYGINQTVEAKVRNLDKVGDILEGAVLSGANQISSLYFKVDKDEEFKERARKLAIEDAKKKAEKLSSQIGVKLIKISGYSESGSVPPIYRNLELQETLGMGGGETPSIQTGENEIIVNVTLTYEID